GPPPHLQWLFNGTPLLGATNNYFALSDVRPNQARNYSVVASNIVGVTTSAVAQLIVSAEAPYFTSEPSDLTVLWGDYVTFYAFAAAGPTPHLRWLFNGTPIPGATDNYYVIPSVVPTQAGNYSVVASNSVGVATSAVAVLTVQAEAPYFVSEPSDVAVFWGES